MMKRMSFGETIFLFVLALVVFGPKKLPEIARQVGRYLNEFKRASNEFKAQIEQEIAHLEVQEKEQIRQKTLAASNAEPEGTASRSLKPAPADNAPSTPALAEASLAGPVEAAANTGSETNSSEASASANPTEIIATEAVPAVANEITPEPVSNNSVSDSTVSSTPVSVAPASQESHA
jgi:sec-independent protein translocase protein TatB